MNFAAVFFITPLGAEKEATRAEEPALVDALHGSVKCLGKFISFRPVRIIRVGTASGPKMNSIELLSSYRQSDGLLASAYKRLRLPQIFEMVPKIDRGPVARKRVYNLIDGSREEQ